MSNYPPGVTGFEPQIAGADELVWDVETCPNDDTEFLVSQDALTPLRSALNYARFRGYSEENTQRIVEAAGQLLEIADAVLVSGINRERAGQVYNIVASCPFTGRVDAQHSGGIISWTCPICGADHEENAPEPEPPERDRWDDE